MHERAIPWREYIRQERLKRGITQEQLCAGICEPITVSRMENGKQTPSYSRICAFLQRLGLPDDRYFALLSKNEMEIKVLQDELRAILSGLTAQLLKIGPASVQRD